MNKKNARKKIVREQPRKDNRQKRVNYDNAREDKVVKDIACTDKSNDVAWYAHNPELLRSAASLAFSNTTGLTLPWNANFTGGYNVVPGVLAMEWVPTLGGNFTEAVNQAKNSIYSYTVHANSRNTRYNATDEMLVILAGAQLFSFLALGIRAYGTMRLFDQRNAYLPEALIRAMGFDYSDLQSNLSQMWFDLNEMVARSSQIWIPNNLPFIERWFWLNSNIYMDSDSVKGQYYLFNPCCPMAYNETYNSEGGALTPVYIKTGESTSTTWGLGGNPFTWAQYKQFINTMFDALLDSEDRGIIFGDILKAYGSENIYALKPVPVDYTVVPVYDKEVLTQIENANTFRFLPSAFAQSQETLDLYTVWGQAGGSIDTTRQVPNMNVLNFHQIETPTPEQVMVATRLKVLGSVALGNETGGTQQIIPQTMGTEYLYRVYSVRLINHAPSLVEYHALRGLTPNTYDFYVEQTFDWSPWLYQTNAADFAVTGAASTYVVPQINIAFGDYDNYTIIDTVTLQKMHQTAIYSEFGVPTI